MSLLHNFNIVRFSNLILEIKNKYIISDFFDMNIYLILIEPKTHIVEIFLEKPVSIFKTDHLLVFKSTSGIQRGCHFIHDELNEIYKRMLSYSRSEYEMKNETYEQTIDSFKKYYINYKEGNL